MKKSGTMELIYIKRLKLEKRMNLAIQLLIIFVIWFCGNFMISKVFRFVTKKNDKIHISFIGSIVKAVWLVLAVITVTGMFETTKNLSTTLLTSSSLLVAVAGFAAQEVLADIISGLTLSWTKPFDVGEKINIADLNISGIVENMTLRHTVIRTYHNSRLLVPNSIINKAVVKNQNYSHNFVGNYLEIPVDYSCDLERAIQIMEEAVEENPLVIRLPESEKKTSVLIKDFSENGIILKCTIRTETLDDNFIACTQLRREIKKRYDAEGIKIFYQRIKIIEEPS